jgi:hypothetical protein
MKIKILITIWGLDYIELFFNYCLPSLDLKNYEEENEFEFLVYTQEKDIDIIDKRLKNKNKKIKKINQTAFELYTPIEIQSKILSFEASKNSDVLFILPPDTIWSKNFLKYAISDLKNGKHALFVHYARINYDKNSDINYLKMSTNKNGYDLYQQVIPHISELHKCHSIDTKYPTKWPEYYFSQNNEVQVARIIIKEPIFITSNIKLDKNNHVLNANENSCRLFGNTKDVFSVSLTGIEKDKDWYQNLGYLNPEFVSEWLKVYNNNETQLSFFKNQNIIWDFENSDKEQIAYCQLKLDKFSQAIDNYQAKEKLLINEMLPKHLLDKKIKTNKILRENQYWEYYSDVKINSKNKNNSKKIIIIYSRGNESIIESNYEITIIPVKSAIVEISLMPNNFIDGKYFIKLPRNNKRKKIKNLNLLHKLNKIFDFKSKLKNTYTYIKKLKRKIYSDSYIEIQ